MIKNDQVYLENITNNISRFEFERNIMMQDAVIRNIEIIGEASKKVTKHFIQSHPEIPWQEMAGMRDKLIHDYLGVDISVVWKTIEVDLPLLKEMISKI